MRTIAPSVETIVSLSNSDLRRGLNLATTLTDIVERHSSLNHFTKQSYNMGTMSVNLRTEVSRGWHGIKASFT